MSWLRSSRIRADVIVRDQATRPSDEMASHVYATRQSSQSLDVLGAAAVLPGLYAVAHRLAIPEHHTDPRHSLNAACADHPCRGDTAQLRRYLQARGLWPD